MNIDFGFYFSLFLRRIHYFLVFVFIGAAAGLTIASVLPPVYRTQAKLILDPPQIDGSLVEIGPTAQIQTIEERVMTRERLLEMANRLNIYPRNSEGARLSADAKVADMRERITIVMTGGDSGNSRGPVEATLLDIGFVADSGALSADVSNRVADMFVQENISMRTGISGSALDFARQRKEELERQLTQLDADILAFQQENINLLPENADFRREQQANFQERLAQLQRDERALTEQSQVLTTIFNETGNAGSDPSARLSPEAQQLREMEANLQALLGSLAPTHPRVQQLENQVDAMRTIVASQQGTVSTDTATSSAESLFNMRMGELEGQLALVSEQREQLQTALDQISENISRAPSIAVTLSTLQRTYANKQDQYNIAVARLNQAEDGQLIEAGGRGGRLRINENAVAPTSPNSPNRPILAAAGIGGGFAIGLAFIVLLELLNTAVRRPVEISNKLGITPLGVIPNIRTGREQIRRRALMIAAFALVLILVPLTLWLIHTQVIGLDVALNKVLLQFGLPLI